MKTPILDKIGSDPEFIPGIYNEFDLTIIPASKVIGSNKQVALNSFIGTDGHASIGELRPRPCHNIRQHLYDIAAGLITTHEYIARRRDLKNVSLFANPEVGGETLAGHIHLSFFVDDQLTNKALAYGRIQGLNGQLVNSQTCGLNTPPPPPPPEQAVSILAEYARAATMDELVTPQTMAKTLGFFLKPLEWWLQPWHARIRRNRHYGLGLDEIRWQQSGMNPLTRPKLADYAWLHFEYRTPSTWLVHPWLAYTYLSLAKITMKNWQLIQRLNETMAAPFMSMAKTPNNEAAAVLFKARWKEFIKSHGRITRDTSHVERAIETCAANREAWFSTHGKIQIEAWRGLL